MLAVERLARENRIVEIGVGNVVLNGRDLNRRALEPLNAVAFALGLVIADQRAEDAQRIVFEEPGAGFVEVALEEELNHLGNVRLHRTAFRAAHRFLALQAAA